MSAKNHQYSASIEWTGNKGEGTSSYKSYQRDWRLVTNDKQVIECSNDPVLGGDLTKHNPEDLLVASVASCHMLWYLHLCSVAGIVVTSYQDTPAKWNPRAPGILNRSRYGRKSPLQTTAMKKKPTPYTTTSTNIALSPGR